VKTLERRVQHLEARYGTTAPVPWERPGWEPWSGSEQMDAFAQYIAAHPQSRLARKWRAIETLTDSELEELLAEVQAQRGEPGCVAGKAVHGESAIHSKHVSTPPGKSHTALPYPLYPA
jgi:hypothetical protein